MTLQHTYDGGVRYRLDQRLDAHRLLVSVTCFLDEPADDFEALLDTASEWCVLSKAAMAAIDCRPVPGEPLERLSTRFGTFEGWVERLPVRFQAETGVDLTVEATWFVCPDWPGPMVLGWKGCLERIRFAVDPNEDAFYFGRR